MESAVDVSWLIKSSGRVLGPLSAQAIAERLATREYTVMDEVSRPCGRWTFIRDEPVFAKIVQELRFKNVRADDDTTQAQTTSGGSTQTLSLTDNLANDERTAEIPPPEIQDAVYQSFEKIADRPKHGRSVDDVFVYEGDVRAQQAASMRWLWILTGVIGAVTLLYIGFNQFVAKPIQIQSASEEHIGMGLQALEIGKYTQALEHLRQANLNRPDDRSILLPLSVLEIQIGGETVKAIRHLDQLKGSSVDSKRLLVARGLADMRTGEFRDAEKYFDQALQLDSLFQPALLNLGAAALYQNDPQRATGYLQLAIKDGSRGGVAHLMAIEALSELAKKGREQNALRESVSLLRPEISVNKAYFHEKLIATMYAMKLLGSEAQIPEVLPMFLDAPVTAASPFKQDLFVHHSRLDWRLYGQWCLESMALQEPTAYIVAAESVCLFKMGDLLAASRKIEDAVAQAPKDKLIHAMYANLLWAMSSSERADAASHKALQLDGSGEHELPLYIAATICQQKGDIGCSEKHWRNLLRHRPQYIYAHGGLAADLLKKGELEAASKFVESALQLNPNYIDALELKEKITQAKRRRGF